MVTGAASRSTLQDTAPVRQGPDLPLGKWEYVGEHVHPAHKQQPSAALSMQRRVCVSQHLQPLPLCPCPRPLSLPLPGPASWATW